MADSILDYMNAPEIGRPDDPPFKVGKPSEHELGVAYQGPWVDQADGFSEHVRRCARALALTGCPVHLRSSTMHVEYGVAKGLPQAIEPLLTASISRYSVMIHQLIPDAVRFQQLMSHQFLDPATLAMVNRFKVISTVFERDRLGQATIHALQHAGQVWVACQLNAKVLEECGIPEEKIRVVRIPYFDDDPLLKMRGFKKPKGPVWFYHIGKWEPRKNQDKIVLAFMRAFKPGMAKLMIKTSAKAPEFKDYPNSVGQVVLSSLNDEIVKQNGWTTETVAKDIYQKTQKVTDDQIRELHRTCSVYISLSSGEGFDMPAFDAKLAGNLLVFTPSGGPQDFADANDEEVPSCGMRPSNPFYREFAWEPDAQYLDFELDAAVAALQAAYSKAKQGFGTVEVPKYLQQFSAENVGKAMLQNLEDLVEPLQGKVFLK